MANCLMALWSPFFELQLLTRPWLEVTMLQILYFNLLPAISLLLNPQLSTAFAAIELMIALTFCFEAPGSLAF